MPIHSKRLLLARLVYGQCLYWPVKAKNRLFSLKPPPLLGGVYVNGMICIDTGSIPVTLPS